MAHKSKSQALGKAFEKHGLRKGADARGVTRLTTGKKKRFCSELERTGNVAAACRLVGISRVTAYKHRKMDPGFARMWEEAREAACDRVEQALLERATEGVEVPVWYKGQQVGARREFSDTAAIFYLKGRRPTIFAQGPQGVHNLTVNDNRAQIVGISDAQLESLIGKRLGLTSGASSSAVLEPGESEQQLLNCAGVAQGGGPRHGPETNLGRPEYQLATTQDVNDDDDL